MVTRRKWMGGGSCWADKERRQATRCMIPRIDDFGRTGGWHGSCTSQAEQAGETMGRKDMDVNNVLFVEGLMVSRSSCADA
jgi:hypothetical protein